LNNIEISRKNESIADLIGLVRLILIEFGNTQQFQDSSNIEIERILNGFKSYTPNLILDNLIIVLKEDIVLR
jgi:hypothetical protein